MGIHQQLQEIFTRIWQFLRRHFLPNVHFQSCMLLQGTLGGDFDIFAASGESTAWVLLWKTRSRPNWPESLFCSPSQLFSAPHLIRVSGRWLCNGRKTRDVSPKLKTKEEMRPALHHHQDLLSWSVTNSWTARSAWTSTRMVPQLLHLLVGEREREREK